MESLRRRYSLIEQGLERGSEHEDLKRDHQEKISRLQKNMRYCMSNLEKEFRNSAIGKLLRIQEDIEDLRKRIKEGKVSSLALKLLVSTIGTQESATEEALTNLLEQDMLITRKRNSCEKTFTDTISNHLSKPQISIPTNYISNSKYIPSGVCDIHNELRTKICSQHTSILCPKCILIGHKLCTLIPIEETGDNVRTKIQSQISKRRKLLESNECLITNIPKCSVKQYKKLLKAKRRAYRELEQFMASVGEDQLEEELIDLQALDDLVLNNDQQGKYFELFNLYSDIQNVSKESEANSEDKKDN